MFNTLKLFIMTKQELIDNSVDTIYRSKLSMIKSFDNLRDCIKDLVVNCGGYINIANNDEQHDNCYGAIFDYNGA